MPDFKNSSSLQQNRLHKTATIENSNRICLRFTIKTDCARTCAIQSPLGYQHTAVYCIWTFSGIVCIQIKLRCAGFFFSDSKQIYRNYAQKRGYF